MFTLLLAIAASVAPRCDRPAPQPLGFHARGFGYVAEVFPPASRQNATARPVVHFFSVDHPGTAWRVDARWLWTASLPHEFMPQAALVSMAGHVVTLDDHHQAGGTHALVIVDRDGRLVRDFALAELLDSADLALVPLSDCGRLWREHARFYFTRPANSTLYVLLPWGRVLALTLTTGELRRGVAADFPDLGDILARSFPNEETEVWPLNLRFSSLSDLMARN